MVNWLLEGILNWLAEKVQGVLSWLVDFLTSTVFMSPDVTVFPQVQALEQRSALIVQAVFGLAVVAAALIGMTFESVQIRYSLKDLVPRLVFAFIASSFGTPLCAGLIQLANALTTAMAGHAASGPRVITFVKQQITAAMADAPTALLSAIVGLLIVVLFFQLLFSWFARVFTLLIVAGTAPIALACYALPQTQRIADMWWAALLGALAVPMLQAVVFTTGVDLILDPAHAMPVLLGLPASNVINLLFVVCLLTLTLRIPRAVARLVSPRSSTSLAGVVARAVVIQSVARRVPGARRLVR